MVTLDQDSPSLAKPRQRKKASRIWWEVHQWAGLKFSILLSFILLTGTLATLSHEIDWLLRPAMRVSPASVASEVNWAAVAKTAAAQAGEGRVISLEAPTDPWFAATAVMENAEGGLYFVYAHPVTGALKGHGHWVSAQRILRNMHRHLMMPIAIGVPIVSSLSLLLAISLVTSFVVYKKWWRGFLRPIRLTDLRTAMGDFHRLAGLWSLWFILLMILTGLWYLAEETAFAAPRLPSVKAEPAAEGMVALASRLPVTLEAARTANPDLRIERILFPTETSGAFVLHGQDAAILVRPRANAIFTDAGTGKVLLVNDGRDLSFHQRLSEAADPLHFGVWGGLTTKIIWFAFGLALTSLSVSGVAIYALRLIRAERRPPRWGQALVLSWRGMGVWRWPALVLVIIGFVLIPSVFLQA
ncbi:MAG: PepSY-associated TM helix domain-containing protein [Phenylobacterium sp.]|uniref:PepSY-associated TM helix domain-containing protein n=1 Tax=Phenylobacterium sp. TaxID=1871053 RepID=UPI002729114B|nr:PepSY-associated TM helix domain-containing protein [Phenylobacterium sp.]MDO8902782.1 PepSY-associated TM helix domain-containing protein [Phenylobacterium sp.]